MKKIQADTRFALTGTPVENRLSELWSIFDYLMPGFLYSYSRFREELEVQIVQHESEEAGERLRKMIRPFVLRRLKKDVLRDLPEKLEEVYQLGRKDGIANLKKMRTFIRTAKVDSDPLDAREK